MRVRLYGWQAPGAREKAQKTNAEKLENGYHPLHDSRVKPINKEWEERVMKDVDYERK